jgi:hypothetical protein
VIESRVSLISEGANGVDAGRRWLLTLGIRLALAMALDDGKTEAAASCTDPDDLSGADVALRKSVEYTDFSSDDKKTCRGCAFFKAGAGGCGTCQILSGLVSAAGHCTSWSARASVNSDYFRGGGKDAR